MAPDIHATEVVAVTDLRPHPRNYRGHPEDQLVHLAGSLREHGFYRNVVIARDGTILAGHGVVEAAKREGVESIPVIRLDIEPDSAGALKILTGDNELPRLGESNDRELADLLKQLSEMDDGLLGTGYDEQQLANLIYVTRPESEIEDFSAAAAWAGLPEFDAVDKPLQVVVSFRNEEDRDAFMKIIEVTTIYKRTRATRSFWWPDKPYDKPADTGFVAE